MTFRGGRAVPWRGRAIPRRERAVYTGMQRFRFPVGRLPDEALLSGLATGDPELAVTFVRRFQHKVFGVAVAVTGDPQLAEDSAQQTFERAWRQARSKVCWAMSSASCGSPVTATATP